MQSLDSTLKPSACSWDCKTAASAGRLQDFTAQCCLESWRTKSEVNLSALQKFRCNFNGTQWQRFYSWWKEMAHYVSKENCSLSGFLPTKRLSAQNDIWGFLWSTMAVWTHAIFGCQVQFRHLVLLQGFSDCDAAWGWIPFLIIHSRGYTASSPARLRNQSCLVSS